MSKKRKKGEKAGKNGHHVVDDSDSTNKIAVPERPSDRDDDAEEELLRDARTRFADDGSLIAGDADDDATQELDEDNPTRALDADAIDELERDRATRMGADVLRALETDEKEDDADPFESRFDFSTGTRHPALNEDEPSTAELEPPDPGSADAASPRLQSIVESVLFAADRPLNLRQLADLVEEPEVERIRAAVLAVEQSWRERGVQLHEVAGGYQFRTHPANAGWVQKLLQQKPVRLSRALLETLAIVSYRQPITRPEIDEIRGVDSGGTLKTLMDRSLVRILGKREEVGRPLLYGTTKEFLEFFSLRDLKDLPTLREFHELSEEHEAQVAALEEAAPAGSIVAEGEDDETEALPRLSRLEIAQPKEDAAELAEIDRLIRTAGASIVTDSDLHAERDAAVDPHNDAANDTAEERVVTSRFAPVREEVSEFDEERMRTMQFGEPLPSPATHQGEEDEDFEQDEATRLRGGLDAELVDRRDPDKEPQ